MCFQYTLFYYLKSHYYVQLMQFIFVHQNFPGQFRHSAKALAQDDTHQVVAIGHFPELQGASALDPRIKLFGYKTPKASHGSHA